MAVLECGHWKRQKQLGATGGRQLLVQLQGPLMLNSSQHLNDSWVQKPVVLISPWETWTRCGESGLEGQGRERKDGLQKKLQDRQLYGGKELGTPSKKEINQAAIVGR